MVQEIAGQLLLRQDNIAQNRARDREMRLATIIPFQAIEEALPEEYTDVIEAAEAMADLNQEGVDYDFSQVEWETPEGMDPQDLIDLEEFLGSPQVAVRVPVDEEWV